MSDKNSEKEYDNEHSGGLFDFENVKGYDERRISAYNRWKNEQNNLEKKGFSGLWILLPVAGCFIGAFFSIIKGFEIVYGVMCGLLIGVCIATFMMRKR